MMSNGGTDMFQVVAFAAANLSNGTALSDTAAVTP
jgi:hypothetical protein